MKHAVDLLRRIGRGQWSRYGLLLLLLALSFAPTGKVLAQCYKDPSSPGSQGIVTFSPPATIPVPVNVPANTVLWTSDSVTPSPIPVYDCYGTVNYGVKNNIGASPAANVQYFPTGVTGLAYVLIHPGAPLYSYPNSSEAFGNNGSEVTFSVPTILELVATGTITNGSVLAAGTIGYWQWQGNGNPQIEAFTLANKVTFVSSSCAVATNPINVTLPTISTTALGGTGTTAGTTPFNITLNCTGAAGMSVSLELDANGTASGIQGVLTPTSGSSSGVGVQVLDQNSTAVTFGTAVSEGTTPVGQMNIPFYARYYQTKTAVTAGTLAASATFTLTYQ
jgi:type 1 fimbria pilin